MKTRIVTRALALSCCALGLVILMSQSPAFAGYSWCNRDVAWNNAWHTGAITCHVDIDSTSPSYGQCLGSCYHQQTVVNSPDQCYSNSTIKCQTCNWDNPPTETFHDQEQRGKCVHNTSDETSPQACYCVEMTRWSDIIRDFAVSAPIKRCHTLNPCL